MGVGSSAKRCVNPKYPVLHLGVSVLSVCYIVSLSQRLWLPQPSLSNADLLKSRAWSSGLPWPNPLGCSPTDSPVQQGLTALQVLSLTLWWSWQEDEDGNGSSGWGEGSEVYAPWDPCQRHFCAPQLRVLSIQICRADIQHASSMC